MCSYHEERSGWFDEDLPLDYDMVVGWIVKDNHGQWEVGMCVAAAVVALRDMDLYPCRRFHRDQDRKHKAWLVKLKNKRREVRLGRRQ